MLKRHVDAAKYGAAYPQIGFAEFCLNGTQTLWDPLVICGIIGKPKFELFFEYLIWTKPINFNGIFA